MRIIHIIWNPNDTFPLEIAKAQGGEHNVAFHLLHDAVYLDTGLKAYAFADYAEARGLQRMKTWGTTGL